MVSEDNILSTLKKCKIFLCSKNTNVEIVIHGKLSEAKKSYLFDCIKLENGDLIYDVYIAIDHEGSLQLEIHSIDFLNPVGLGGNAIINQIKKDLRKKFDCFLRKRSDVS